MIDRRRFLKNSAFISLAPTMPTFLCKLAAAATMDKTDSGRILIVIQLDGGNDGINTIVPFKDEGYAKHRDELCLPESDLIKVTNDFAFHPRMRSASELFEDGRLSIVHGVGYPNPNRSHFESMAIWQVGSTDEELRQAGNGWLGAALSGPVSASGPQAIHVGDETLPVSLRGRRCTATTILSPTDLQLRLDVASFGSSTTNRVLSSVDGSATNESLRDFVTTTVNDAYASARELASATRADATARYPDSKLGHRLRLISQIIKAGTPARAYYTLQPGYDTHAAQLPTHGNLLGEFSSSLKAFMDDMRNSGLEDRVLVMAFSEFGRRVNENDSSGTDHGTAGPVIISGTKLADRSLGELPSLTDLEDGDLKYSIDFRHLYSAILSDWLGLDLPPPLQGFGLTGAFRVSSRNKS